MGNYVGTARSNHFKVKDIPKFTDFCDTFGATVEPSHNHKGKICIIFEEEIPSEVYNHEDGEGVELDIMQEISKHLVKGEVAILMESGHEKKRYCSGYAMAVNSAGEYRDIGIDAIYDMAKELTTPAKSKQITRAQY